MKFFIAREAMDPHFKMAGNLMRKSVPLSGEMKTLVKLMGFYTLWHPKQVIGLCLVPVSGMGCMSERMNYTKRTAHRLAVTMFGCMAVYQAKLKKKQILLGHLVEIGMELFAMSETFAYALSIVKKRKGDLSPYDLADTFCKQARRRIAGHFRAIRSKGSKELYDLAGKVLAGNLKWMVDEIIWIGSRE